MKLLTKAIEKTLPALYSLDGKPAEEVKIAVKFFTPDANITWYATEGEIQEDGDVMFFGFVRMNGYEGELGYFTLNQIKAVRGRFGLPAERDRNFTATLAEVKSGTKL